MPDQTDIHRMCLSEDIEDRIKAIELLRDSFSILQDKSRAWEDLHRLTQDKKSEVQGRAARTIGMTFGHIPDKSQAWGDLVRLTQDHFYSGAGERAACAMGMAFSLVPDKSQAWKDLIELIYNSYWDRSKIDVRRGAARALGIAFPHIPYKSRAWDVLIRLIKDEDYGVHIEAERALGTAFNCVPNKSQAWKSLHWLTQDEYWEMRCRAARAIGIMFDHIPDKSQAWEDLHRLTHDEDHAVQGCAVKALGMAFGHVPDKSQAWEDLHRLTQNVNTAYYPSVRWCAVSALGIAFGHIPDKSQAWEDLHRLTKHEDPYTRWHAQHALGIAFGLVTDKPQAWEDLHRLTRDEDSDVRMHAYHSLGRASIFKSAEADDTDALKKELEAAVKYFEKSSQEHILSPARFCYSFYSAYLAVTFQEAKGNEVQKYLIEAKEAVGISESKEELLNAVENLARALQGSQRLKDRPLEEIASELNAYRWYCDKAAEHMATAEDKAPGAVNLMRRCNPLIEETIQATIEEIQEKARQICQITLGSGTEYETPGVKINKAAKALSSRDLVSIHKCSFRMVGLLEKFCELLPEETSFICELVEEIKPGVDLPERLSKIELALSYLSPILKDKVKSPAEQEILGLLKNIEYNTSKLSISSGDTKQNVFYIRLDIKNLKDMIQDQDRSIKQIGIALNEIGQGDVERLEIMRKELLEFTEKIIIQNRSSDEKAQEILEKMRSMEQLKARDYASILSDVITIGSYLNWLLGFPAH